MRNRILIVLIGWLAAVLAVAVIASIAIDSAGRQVISAPIAAPYPTVSTSTTAATTGSPEPDPTPSEVNLTARPNSTRSAPPKRQKSHPNAARPTSEPTPDRVASTYTTLAGRVRVTCSGARITLGGGYALPASGWAVSIRDSGPRWVRVRFEQTGRRDLTVVAVCAGGRPQFEQSRSERRRGAGRHDGRHRGGMFRNFDGSSDH